MPHRLIWLAWAVRLFFGAVALFLPLGLPHIWRQVDTLGVSLRYWLRWTVETSHPWPLLPAILHSGDQMGIMAMEFPLLNLLAAPFFSLGPALGTGMARAMILLLNLALVLLNRDIWKGQTLAGIDARASWRWMPLVGLGLIYFPKFIPDAPAMLLALAATGFFAQNRRLVLATVLLLLGLLMKPTAGIVLALLLLSPRPVICLRRSFGPIVCAATLGALYYLMGTRWLQSLGSGDSLYRLAPQNPWQALRDFLAQPRQLIDLLVQSFGFWLALPLLLVSSALARAKGLIALWLVLVVQIVAIAILDGEHSYQHRYYFMGTLPAICLLLEAFLAENATLPLRKELRWTMLLLLLGSSLSQLAYEWKPLYADIPVDRFLSFRDCRELKQQLQAWPWGRGYVFQTRPRPYPLVGLCLGERVGSDTAPYGIFLDIDPLPDSCRMVARAGHMVGAFCQTASGLAPGVKSPIY